VYVVVSSITSVRRSEHHSQGVLRLFGVSCDFTVRLAIVPQSSGLDSISKLHGPQTAAGALKEVWTLYCISRLQQQKGAQEQVCSIDHGGPGLALMLVSSAGLKRCQLDLLPLLVHNYCCCVMTTPGLRTAEAVHGYRPP
jgi:hypothetical protein